MPFGREILSSTYCGSPEKKALSDFSHGTTQLSNTMEICILINCLYSYSNRFRRRCTPKCRHQSWRHSSGRHQRWIAAYWIPKSEHTELNELSIRESLKFQAESDAPRRLQAIPFMGHQAKLANWFRIIEFHFSLFSSRPLIWVCIPCICLSFGFKILIFWKGESSTHVSLDPESSVHDAQNRVLSNVYYFIWSKILEMGPDQLNKSS